MNRCRAGVVSLMIVGTVGIAGPVGAKPPSACVRALEQADKIRELFVEFTGSVAAYMGSDQDAAGAHELTRDAQRITGEVGPAVRAYDRAAKACRKS